MVALLTDMCAPEEAHDPQAAAREAGLRYVTDAMPGIRRHRRGQHFTYIGVDGQPLRDEAQRRRIEALAIPPAWRDVWIAPLRNAHIQAVGRDAKGRKQYRYHERWRSFRDEAKFGRMIAFGEALPAIRLRTEEDLSRPGLSREKVLATVVCLLESTHIRIGNDEYARLNESFGLTTLRSKHVAVSGSAIHFHFKGKSGITHDVDLYDRRLARIVQRCRELPGQELFSYIDENAETHGIDSGDVNEYLRQVAGQDYTAKDYRTWAGTVLATQALLEAGIPASKEEERHHIAEAIAHVAEQLGNTANVCRKCYVHPDIISAYGDGTLHRTAARCRASSANAAPSMHANEVLTLCILRETAPE